MQDYCKPLQVGLDSEPKAVARALAKVLDAMDGITTAIVEGEIADEINGLFLEIRSKLEAEGWTVSFMNGNLDGTDHVHVYPPGSKIGAKIRRYRKELEGRE